MLGGGSAINGMMFVRGHRSDYDHWESLGADGWGYDGVLPYFRRLETNERGGNRWRGDSGPLPVSDVRVDHALTDAFIAGMTELGVERSEDLNGADAEGVDFCQVTQRRGLRASTASAYIWPVLRRRENLSLELGATAERLIIESARTTGVEYTRNGTRHTARSRRGVVVCAGALASPKLLLHSGIGPAGRLASCGIETQVDLPGVGRNLQEHAGMILSAHVTVHTLTSDRNPFRALMHGLNYLARGRGPLSNPVGHAHAFVRTSEQLSRPDVQIIFSPLAFDHHEGGATPYPKPAVNIAVGLCRVASRGEVRLRSGDPKDPPVVDYSLLADSGDVQTLAAGLRFARRLFETPSFAPYFVDERKPGASIVGDEALTEAIRRESFLMYHPCGTCKMGTDRDSVVGPDLRVQGIDGLWVADASIIPTIPAGNINATTIMIGEKAADLIVAADSP